MAVLSFGPAVIVFVVMESSWIRSRFSVLSGQRRLLVARSQ